VTKTISVTPTISISQTPTISITPTKTISVTPSQTTAPPLTLTMDASSRSSSCSLCSTCTPADTQAVTGTAAGGYAPYTYLWEYVSGDTNIEPLQFTNNSTRFQTILSVDCDPTPPGVRSAVYRLKVTDNISQIAYGDTDVTITFSNTYSGTCC
jgi:hypothetical protein